MSRQEIIALVKKTTGMVVQTGPFSGLRFHDVQTWGCGEDVGPQLLGIYEQELHSILLDFIAARPSTVINVGCAAGYYAAGLARLLPDACVFAFDIDAGAQNVCRANATLNGVAERIQVDGACTPARLCELAAQDPNILIVADCEGCEKILFADKSVAAALQFANIVIETHDFPDRNILSTLVSTFVTSHRISVIRSGSRNPNAFPFLDNCCDADKWLLVRENRPEAQSWLVCERRSLPRPNLKAAVKMIDTRAAAIEASISTVEPEAAANRAKCRPLIYTVCFGGQTYFDCLSLMLQSLDLFGKYSEEVLVLTDRDESECGQNVHVNMRDRVQFLKVTSPGMMTRYLIRDFLGVCDRPVLYVDTDIIVTQNIEPILHRIGTDPGIYVCSEADLHQDVKSIPASAIDRKWANFFGLELFQSDTELRDRPLLWLNSGLFGFSSRSVFEDAGLQIHSMYSDDKWSAMTTFMDQPFFNYVIAKSKCVDTGLLSGSVALVDRALSAREFSRPFVHFLWARGDEKAQQMSQYMDFLKSSCGG